MIKIIAVLCSLSSPVNCHEQTRYHLGLRRRLDAVLMGVPQLAEWMKQHPAERLAALSDAETEVIEEDWSECLDHIKTARAALSK